MWDRSGWKRDHADDDEANQALERKLSRAVSGIPRSGSSRAGGLDSGGSAVVAVAVAVESSENLDINNAPSSLGPLGPPAETLDSQESAETQLTSLQAEGQTQIPIRATQQAGAPAKQDLDISAFATKDSEFALVPGQKTTPEWLNNYLPPFLVVNF